MSKIKDLSGSVMKQVSLAQKHYPSQKLSDLIEVIEPLGDQLLLREIPDESMGTSLILSSEESKNMLLPFVRALVVKVSKKQSENFKAGDVVYFTAQSLPINFPNFNPTKDKDCFYVMQYAHNIMYKIPKDKVVKVQ